MADQYAPIGTGYVPDQPDQNLPGGGGPDNPPDPPGPGGDPPGNPPGPGGGGGGGGGNGGGGGSGGGGSGGGGGPGGGGSPPPPPPPSTPAPKEKDRWARYIEILQGWGLTITNDMKELAHLAAKKHWATGTFLYFARQTDWYKEFFKGKPADMSEGQYNALVRNFQTTANRIGEHIDRGTAAYLISHNISVGEFSDRVTAVQRINDNADTMQAFIGTLRARGIIKGDRVIKREDLLNFALHRGPDEWLKVWEEASVRTAASEAGFVIGHNITRNEIMRIANQLPGYQSEQDVLKGFQQLAQNVKQLVPLSRLVGMGINRRQLEELSFGGPNAPAIAAKAQSILQAYKNALTAPPTPQLVQTTDGAKLLGGLEGLAGNQSQ